MNGGYQNMKNLLKVLLALTLALALVFSSAASVLAADVDKEIVVSGDEVIVGGQVDPALSQSHELDGNLTVKEGDPALKVDATGYDSSFTVTGTVSDTQDDTYVTAVKVDSYNHKAEVNIGEVVAEAAGTNIFEVNGLKVEVQA
jgi:hypothetical protein